MEYTEIPKLRRRIWTITNIFSLFLFASIFQMYYLFDLNPSYLIPASGCLVLLIISFYYAFTRTGLWRFTHQAFNKLDERETQISGNATRISYAVFTILTLTLFLIFSYFGIKISIVLAVSLLYFAHILPASIIAIK